MAYPLEYYLMKSVGDTPPFDLGGLPNRPLEYYLMLLVGETPPVDFGFLPRRSYGYYLSMLAYGDTSGMGQPEEVMWMLLTGESPPVLWRDLPRRPLEYYLSIIAEGGLGRPFFFSLSDVPDLSVVYEGADVPGCTVESGDLYYEGVLSLVREGESVFMLG
jgi:hypothetical protein